MSKTELKAWLVCLGITGTGAVLALLLPVSALTMLLYLFVGILLVFCPAAVFYLFCAFVVSALLALVLPKRAWLRLAISAVVVLGGAHLVSAQLNAPYDRAFAQLVAQDVPLTLRPPYGRIVLVDDRDDGRRRAKDEGRPCYVNNCIAYLANGQVQGVLVPADPRDRLPVAQRAYRVFSQRPGCAPAADFNDLRDRIWKGDCLADEEIGAVAAGDLIVHAFRIDVPNAVRDCDCERVEVFMMTKAGPFLIKRETKFWMRRYGDIPIPARDAGWNGLEFDHGLSWMTGRKGHGRDYATVLEDDLRLNSDIAPQGNR